MPLTTINSAKELAITYQPILAAVITFADGTILRLSTHPLNAGEGGVRPSGITGFPHNNQDFLGRLSQQDLDAIQSMSDQGVDQISQATLHIADADGAIYLSYHQSIGKGFKGATLELFFLFYDIVGGVFSTNFDQKFLGICNMPEVTPKKITVTATSFPNFQKVQLPQMRIQRRCSWINPVTTAQRAEANDEDSQYYECGETRDLTTAPPCNYTKETCTQPLRFSGVTFAPPDRWRSRGYLDGKTIEGTNSPNDSKYGEPVPLVYGTTWVEPPIMNVIGDANSTRMECLLCIGNLGGTTTTNPGRVIKVLVNDVEIPFVAYSPDKPIFRWEWVSSGARDGRKNTDAGYDGMGDPYGSQAVIEICVYRKLAASEQTPRVRVLLSGPDIRVYSDATTFTRTYSSNPVWVVLDLITWSNVKYSQVDIATFVNVASKCSPAINYRDFNNAVGTHERFDVSIALRDRRSASEVIRSLLRSFNGNLTWNNGKLQLNIRSTLAEQQPAPISGSNYNTAVSSLNYAGAATNGYVAYSFDDSSILERDGEPVIKINQRPILDMPNRVQCQIQDKHNGWNIDSYTDVDPDDVSRAQQEVNTTLDVMGINSYDQAFRISNTFLAEVHRGNPAGDTSGTWIIEFETSFRAVHLRTGQIVRFSCTRLNLTNQLFRIIRIAPGTNYETLRITIAWHSDNWYVDAYGQGLSPAPSGATLDQKGRAPYPWQPNTAAPIASDSMFSSTEKNFNVLQDYSAVDASGVPLAFVQVDGVIPATSFSNLRAPVIAFQANISSSGGSIAGQKQYWIAVCAEDSTGALSAPSSLCSAIISGSGSTFLIQVPAYVWPSSTVAYQVFVGADPIKLAFQQRATGTPSTINIAGPLNVSSYGPPDSEAGRVVVYTKIVQHAGVFGAAITNISGSVITTDAGGFTANQFVGYDLSLLAKSTSVAQPIANFSVTANASNTFTVTPSPTGILEVGDVVVMRSKPSVSGLTITDNNWLNAASNSGLGLDPGIEAGRILRIISGTGRGYSYPIASNTDRAITIAGNWVVVPDATSRYIVEDANWLDNAAEVILRANTATNVNQTFRIELSNYKNQTVLLAGWVLSPDGAKESIEQLTPVRELYIIGRTVSFGSGTFQLEYLS